MKNRPHSRPSVRMFSTIFKRLTCYSTVTKKVQNTKKRLDVRAEDPKVYGNEGFNVQ
jgi:hypothetical protein